MICDKCGFNLTTNVKCPNCGYDNEKTDYTPVKVENFSSNPFVDMSDSDFTPENLFIKLPENVPFHAVTRDLYKYAEFSLKIDIGFLIAWGILALGFLSPDMPNDFGWFVIPPISLFAVDLVCNLLIRLGKEWILIVYIPFSFLFFPVIVIFDLFARLIHNQLDRSLLLVHNRFFIKELRYYLTAGQNERNPADTATRYISGDTSFIVSSSRPESGSTQSSQSQSNAERKSRKAK